MTPVQLFSDFLRRLPAGFRKTLYSVLIAFGGLLAGLVALGYDEIGSISLVRALEIYTYLSPAIGVVAFTNVGNTQESVDPEVDDEVDISAFEPIGSEDDVFVAPAG
jgi:hypothetical protein